MEHVRERWDVTGRCSSDYSISGPGGLKNEALTLDDGPHVRATPPGFSEQPRNPFHVPSPWPTMIREQPSRVGQRRRFDRHHGDPNTTWHCRKGDIDNDASGVTISASATKARRLALGCTWESPGFATHTVSPVSRVWRHRGTMRGRIRLAF